MYLADLYIQTSLLPKMKLVGLPTFFLAAPDASQLGTVLQADATDNFYSAAVSIADALAGIPRGFFSWATVKLYYAAFYGIQSLLASDGHCQFHIGPSPRWIQAQSGSQVIKTKGKRGTTHESIFQYFEQNYSGHLLMSQPISSVPSLRWLYERRVEANYRNAGFGEPSVPPHLVEVQAIGVRLAVEAYLTDDQNLYLFDPDHAMLAFPLRCLRFAHDALTLSGKNLEFSRQTFLNSVFRDKNGPIQRLRSLVN